MCVWVFQKAEAKPASPVSPEFGNFKCLKTILRAFGVVGRVKVLRYCDTQTPVLFGMHDTRRFSIL